MIEFIRALADPDIPFLRYALIAGLLTSVPFGIIGAFVVTRRISYIAGAISHSILAGIGIALFLNGVFGMTWFSPVYGAALSALAAALVIGFAGIYAGEREDSVIGAIWAVGMALGFLFIEKTPGYVSPMSYLFGNILLITKQDLYVISVLGLFIVLVCVLFYNKLLAVCFDEEFALLKGVNVKFYYLLLLCLTSLAIVLLVRIVGIIMVIALLTLPAAVAGHFTKRLSGMMVISALLCMFFTSAGLAVSYSYNLPCGPTIIMIAGICYLAVAYFRSRGRKA